MYTGSGMNVFKRVDKHLIKGKGNRSLKRANHQLSEKDRERHSMASLIITLADFHRDTFTLLGGKGPLQQRTVDFALRLAEHYAIFFLKHVWPKRANMISIPLLNCHVDAFSHGVQAHAATNGIRAPRAPCCYRVSAA